MKRPALITASAVVLTSAIAAFADSFILMLLWLSCVAVICAALIKQKYQLAAALIFCFVLLVNTLLVINPAISFARKYDNKKAVIEGVVIKPPVYRDGCTSVVLRAVRIDGKRVFPAQNISINSKNGLPILQGDKAKFKVSLKFAGSKSNRLSYFSDRVYLYSNSAVLLSSDKDNNIFAFSGKIKAFVYKTVNNALPATQAGVICALLTGDKSGISDSFSNSVASAGVSHILVVSGMHLGLICLLIMKIFCKFLSRRITAFITLACVLLIMAVCDFSFSVLRAGLVYIILLCGILFRRRSDSMSSLCIAVTLILAANPYALFSVSFLLTTMATLGILVAGPYFAGMINAKISNPKANKCFAPVISAVCQTASASIFTLPVLIYYFGRVSAVAVLTNIAVAHVMAIGLWVGVFGVLLAAVGLIKLSTVFLATASLCAKIFVAVVNFMSNLPFAAFPVRQSFAIVCAVFILLFLCLYVLKNKRIIKKHIKIFALALAVIFVCLGFFINRGSCFVTAVYAYSEQCVIIVENGNAVLIGAGAKVSDSAVINSALKLYGVKSISAVYLLGNRANGGAVCRLNPAAKTVYITNEEIKPELAGFYGNILSPPKCKTYGGIKIYTSATGCVFAEAGGNKIFAASKENPTAGDKLNAANADILFCPAATVKYYKGAKINVVSGGINSDYGLNGKTYETVSDNCSFILN